MMVDPVNELLPFKLTVTVFLLTTFPTPPIELEIARLFVVLKLKKVVFAVVIVTEPEPSGFTLPLPISRVP